MLRLLLEPIGVPCNVTASGRLERAPRQERIEFLAAARNALLPPARAAPDAALVAGSAAAGDPHSSSSTNGGSDVQSQRRAVLNSTTTTTSSSSAASTALFAADDVLFVNDVLWCARDAARLLRLDADLVGGLDFGPADDNVAPGFSARRRRRQLLSSGAVPGLASIDMPLLKQRLAGLRDPAAAEHSSRRRLAEAASKQPASQQHQQQHQQPQQNPAAAAILRKRLAPPAKQAPPPPARRERMRPMLAPPPRRALGPSQLALAAAAPVGRLSFAALNATAAAAGNAHLPRAARPVVRLPLYDVWTARANDGARLRWSPPYAHSQATARALARGRPFAVQCVWGGMARVAAAPFAAGLRFRKHMDGECRASECR